VHKLSFLFLAPTLSLFNQSVIGAIQPNIVELQTNVGTIAIQLNYAKAPVSSKNFVAYAQSGFYKDTLIHRVVKDFVIQGGGVDKASGTFKKTSAPIKNEASNGLRNVYGTIAMARVDTPDSATSQFFINLADNSKQLDYKANPKNLAGYAVFGKVIKGLDIVKRIGGFPTVSELPFIQLYEQVFIDNAYTSTGINPNISITRMMVSEGGKITSLPSGINCGKSCVLSQSVAKPLKVTAIPATGYYFAGWRGDCEGITATIAINTKNGNHNCKALFTKAAPTI